MQCQEMSYRLEKKSASEILLNRLKNVNSAMFNKRSANVLLYDQFDPVILGATFFCVVAGDRR
jgi:hypothetical protein